MENILFLVVVLVILVLLFGGGILYQLINFAVGIIALLIVIAIAIYIWHRL